MDGLEKVLTEVELAFEELVAWKRGGRVDCDCCGCGERLSPDCAVTWEEVDESLSEGSVLWALRWKAAGELGGRGENAPGRLYVEGFISMQ